MKGLESRGLSFVGFLMPGRAERRLFFLRASVCRDIFLTGVILFPKIEKCFFRFVYDAAGVNK